MSVKMSQLEIIQYGHWFFKEDLSTDLLNSLKSFTGTSEIEGFDYVKSKLTENLEVIIEKIYQLTSKQNKQAAHDLLYRFYFNRFLIYLRMDAVMISYEQKYNFPNRGVFLHRKPDNNYSIDKLAVKSWFAEELTIPHIMMGYTKAMSSQYIRALFDKSNKEKFTKSDIEKMMRAFAKIEDHEMKEILEDKEKLRNFVNAKLKEGLIANDIANELNISRRKLFNKTNNYGISRKRLKSPQRIS